MFSFFCLWRVLSSADIGAKTGTYAITCANRMVPERDRAMVCGNQNHTLLPFLTEWSWKEVSSPFCISVYSCVKWDQKFSDLWQLHEMMHVRGLAPSLAPGNCLAKVCHYHFHSSDSQEEVCWWVMHCSKSKVFIQQMFIIYYELGSRGIQLIQTLDPTAKSS